MTTTPDRPDNITSYSELSTLAQCEMKWWLKYREDRDTPQTGAMFLGSIMHELTRRWWEGDDWYAAGMRMQSEYHEANPHEPHPDWRDEPWITTGWLMERYVEHYRELRETITVVAHELDLTTELPFAVPPNQHHRAIIDAVWLDPFGDYWMVERKTYGKKDRLELASVDPQLTLNLYVAKQELDLPFRGIVFDGIYTYRWKRDAHPTSDSFEMLWLDRNHAHIASALDDVQAGLIRRQALRSGDKPMRNIGPLCKGCGVRAECFERLAFPNEIAVEEDD